MSKKIRREHHEETISNLRKDIEHMRVIPFNPACEACAKNPIHCKRLDYEKELQKMEREWREEGLDDLEAIDKNIAYWERAYEIMAEIEKQEPVMTIRKSERVKIARFIKKTREAFADRHISPPVDNIDSLIAEWITLETAQKELARHRDTFEKKEQDILSKLQDIVSQQNGLGYTSREDILDAIDGWQHAFETQSMISNRREWMEQEIIAWDTAATQWGPWSSAQKQIEDATKKMAPIRERAERAYATWNARVANAEELRIAESIAAERSVRYHRAKEEWDQIITYQNIAYTRYKQITVELARLREDLRVAETTLAAARKAAEWKTAHDQKMTAYERIWETWRSKRDVLQSTFQRLIGCKDDKSTFKEWIYESFAIPLLEKHVNAFLAESTSSALWIKIEYSSKSLGFIVFDRGNRTTFGLSSGFQQFIIGLAFRLALTRLGGSGHRFRTLIIDEGFVACDADNVQNAREILQIMMEKGGFRHILLATHLDTIKDMIGRKIHIERDGAFSKLRVGPRLELTVPIDTDKPKRGRPKKDAK
jgi:DNA repair exonuclease SbcCD ATPase subunit